MKIISRKESTLFLQCTKPEEYKRMLDVINISWFLKADVEDQRKFLQRLKKGRFKITVSLAKKRGLFFEEPEREIILSSSSVKLLGFLNLKNGYSLTRLSRIHNLSLSTLSGRIIRFLSYGFVRKRKTVVNERRVTEILITQKGIDYLNELRRNR